MHFWYLYFWNLIVWFLGVYFVDGNVMSHNLKELALAQGYAVLPLNPVLSG